MQTNTSKVRSLSHGRLHTRSGAGHPGYTLLELLLVIAILTVVAAAVTPAVVGRMSEYRLKDSVQQVHRALAATRIHSIDRSSTYQFRFELGGHHYLAVPVDNDVLNASTQSSGRSGASDGSSLSAATVEVGELPEEFTFQTVATNAEQLGSNSSAGFVTPSATSTAASATGTNDTSWSAAVARVQYAGPLSGLSWSPPIIFQPDGTATDASMGIVDATGAGYQINVRELTGEILEQHLVTGMH